MKINELGMIFERSAIAAVVVSASSSVGVDLSMLSFQGQGSIAEVEISNGAVVTEKGNRAVRRGGLEKTSPIFTSDRRPPNLYFNNQGWSKKHSGPSGR